MKKLFYNNIWNNKIGKFITLFYCYIFVINIPILTIYLNYFNTNKYCSINLAVVENGTFLSTQTTPGIQYCSLTDHLLWWPIWFAICGIVILIAPIYTMAMTFIFLGILSLFIVSIAYFLKKIYKKFITPLCKKYPIIPFVFDMTLGTLGKLFLWLIALGITAFCVEEYIYYPSVAELHLILSIAVFVIYSFYHFYHKYKKYKIEPTTFLSNFMKDF